MHPLIPMGLVYNDITAAAICQLMVFLIDLSKPYLSVVAVITPEAKGCGVQLLIFFFCSDNCLIFLILLPEILLCTDDLTGFSLHQSPVSPSFSSCLVCV